MVTFMQESGLHIDILITDRHKQNAKWIRENLLTTRHFYDVWHIAKGEKKQYYLLFLSVSERSSDVQIYIKNMTC